MMGCTSAIAPYSVIPARRAISRFARFSEENRAKKSCGVG